MENTVSQSEKKQTIKKMRAVFSHVGFSLFAYDLAVVLFTVGATFLIMRIMSFFGYSDLAEKLLGGAGYNWFATAVFQFIIATGIFLILIGLKKPVIAFDKTKRKLGLKQTVILAVVCISIMQIGAYISNVVSMVVEYVRGAPLESELNSLIMESDIFVVIIMCVIIGPILEEIIFRKCIVDRLRPFGEGFSVVCSALIFAIAHGNFLQVFYSFGLGALLAIIYLKTNNLKICIGYHMFVNFTGSVIPVLFLEAGVLQSAENMVFSPALTMFFMYMVLMFLITAAGILIMLLSFKNIKLQGCAIEGITLSDRVRAFVFNPGMILVFLTAVCSFILSF